MVKRPAPPPEPDIGKVLAELKFITDTFLPGHGGCEFVVHKEDGTDVRLPVPAMEPEPPGLTEFLRLARVAVVAGIPAHVEAVIGGLRFRLDVTPEGRPS